MKSVKSIASLVLIAALAIPFLSQADSEVSSDITIQEGIHYQVLNNPVPPVETPSDKIEIVGMFWYGCPHCFNLEPNLNTWIESKPADVEVVKVPGVLNPRWETHARAFYAAEALGVSDKVHEPMFKAIHEQGRNLTKDAAIVRFVASLGVDGDKFRDAMNSMAAVTKAKKAATLGDQYQLTGVPALIVDGKYRVLNSGIKSYEEMFQITEFLIEKARND